MAIVVKDKTGQIIWKVFCRGNSAAEHDGCGILESCANGTFAEVSAKLHAEHTGHQVMVGFDVKP